jgi:hypothetical protein
VLSGQQRERFVQDLHAIVEALGSLQPKKDGAEEKA